MDQLAERIQQLSGPLVADAVKNLRLGLQYHWKHEVEDQDARSVLENFNATGDAEGLRNSIVGAEQDVNLLERWGRGLLLYLAADEDLRPYVAEAVDDALEASVKDFGITSLIVIGVVLVLLKYRPKELDKSADGIKIKWEENDVSVVADLAKMIRGGE